MTKLDISKWREFRVGDLFDIRPTKHYNDSEGKALPNAKLMEPDGVNPVVVNSSYNNGIGGYTNKPCNERGGIITFSDTTTADAIFYQPNDFVGYSHVQGMYPTGKYADKWSMYSMKFFESVFHSRANALGYNYVNKFTRELASDIVVLLPTDDDIIPNWDYMETYMKDIEKQTCDRIIKLEVIKKSQGTVIDVCKWNKFHLYDIFEISMGNKFDRSKMRQVNPSVNFVGRSGINNGVACEVDLVKDSNGDIVKPYNAGDITIAMGGSIGSAFIQEKDFYTSQNVCVLHTVNPKITLRVKQFITTVITASCKNYEAFVDELNRHIKTDFIIHLPVDDDGRPDWDYIDKYMAVIQSKVTAKINALSCKPINAKDDFQLIKTSIIEGMSQLSSSEFANAILWAASESNGNKFDVNYKQNVYSWVKEIYDVFTPIAAFASALVIANPKLSELCNKIQASIAAIETSKHEDNARMQIESSHELLARLCSELSREYHG